MKWLYVAFYPESGSCHVKKSSENSVSVIGTCLQPKGGKTILKSHDSHSKPVALLEILL